MRRNYYLDLQGLPAMVLFLLTVALQIQELSGNEDVSSAEIKPSAKALHKLTQ